MFVENNQEAIQLLYPGLASTQSILEAADVPNKTYLGLVNALLRIFDLKLQLTKRRGDRYILVEAGVFQDTKSSVGLPRPVSLVQQHPPLLPPPTYQPGGSRSSASPPPDRPQLSPESTEDILRAVMALFNPNSGQNDVIPLLRLSRSESDESLISPVLRKFPFWDSRKLEAHEKAGLADALAELTDHFRQQGGSERWFEDTEIALWSSEPDSLEALTRARATVDHYVSLSGQGVVEMPSDGSCQFHALVRVLDLPMDHTELRRRLVEWLLRNRDTLLPNGAKISDFNGTDWDQYCHAMTYEWGDHLTLVAFASVFGVPIQVIAAPGIEEDELVTETIIAPVPETSFLTVDEQKTAAAQMDHAAQQVVLAGLGVTIAHLAKCHYDAVLDFDG